MLDEICSIHKLDMKLCINSSYHTSIIVVDTIETNHDVVAFDVIVMLVY